MHHHPIRQCAVALCVGGLLAGSPSIASAAQQPQRAQGLQSRGVEQAEASVTPTDTLNAHQTREELKRVLERYPPALPRVLKLDPTLMSNDDYLATYPALAAFLNRNPTVPRNPSFYLEHINIDMGWSDPRSASMRMWEQILGGMAALTVFVVVTGTLIWLVKTIVDYRRWNRLSKIQTEVHTRILDRFGSNDELLAYIQTPTGRRFLESAPIPLEQEPRRLGAPFSRILWSVQAGAVLAVLGFGLLFVSNRIDPDVSMGIFAAGVLALSLGIGFALSAVIAFLLSRRLGLFEMATSDHA